MPSLGNSLQRDISKSNEDTLGSGGRKDIRQGHFEPLLNGLENVLVLVGGNKGDCKTLSTEAAGTTDAVKVRVCVSWQIVVDSQIDSLDIDTATEDVGSDTDTLVELFEFLVSANSVFLCQPH